MMVIYILRVYIYEYTTYERHILVDPKRSTFFKEEKVFFMISPRSLGSHNFFCVLFQYYIY